MRTMATISGNRGAPPPPSPRQHEHVRQLPPPPSTHPSMSPATKRVVAAEASVFRREEKAVSPMPEPKLVTQPKPAPGPTGMASCV